MAKQFTAGTKGGLKLDKTLIFLMLTMMINAIGYGAIIPLFYPYAEQFGLGTFGVSLLLAVFSIAQFVSTPIIGRMSDKYGRRPLLLGSIFGSAISLAMFALATSTWQLFVARILDGITGGNVSVAQAVVADRVKGEERSKTLGMLGAAFGFGILVGPAIGGILSKISLTAPFWFASALAVVATAFGYFFLEESLDEEAVKKAKEPIVNVKVLWSFLSDKTVGILLAVGFIMAIGYNIFVVAFQAYTNEVLKLNPTHIGILFSVLGVVTVFVQAVGLRWLMKLPYRRLTLSVWLLFTSGLIMFISVISQNWIIFMVWMVAFTITNTPASSLLTGELSHRTHGARQGLILGVNQSYASLGQIIGPLLAGAIAHFGAQRSVFWLAGAVLIIGALLLQRDRLNPTALADEPTDV